MFCYKCGTQLEDKSIFCHKCGAKIPDGNADKKKSDLIKIQNQNDDALPEVAQKGEAIRGKKSIQPTSRNDNIEIGFKEFVDTHVQKTTEFESAEALLNRKIPQKFLWACFGVPAILLFILFIREPSFGNLFAVIMLFLLLAYPIALLVDYIFSFRITGGDHKVDGSIDADDLILFLNRNLSYLSPYFNEWNYIKMVGYGLRGVAVAAVQNALQGTRIGTGFGHRQSCFIEIHISPDHLNPDSGQMVYFFSTAIKSIWPAQYSCMTKAAPILQAAMEYYLKEYRSEEKEFSAIVPNLETEKKTNYAAQQALDNGTISDVKSYGDSIKPYYCEQFDRIAHGQRAKFNWAALFLNAWMQLYNGCTRIFCKTFLPFLIVYCLASFIGLLARINYNHTLIVVSSVLGILAGIYGFIMCIINGFCFNKWYYQDVINNPAKRRSRKGFWFLIVAEITMIVILQLTGHLVTKHIMDSFDDYYDGSDDDFDNDFYDYSYSDFDDYSIDDADEDWLVEYSEDSVSIQGENIEDNMIDTVQYEEIAREIIIEWFSRHPLQHNFRIEFMNETANTKDGSGIYLIYEMYWGDDEWYGSFYVNPASGDMNMNSMIKANGITTVQESMDQWYLEDYWFLGEDLGGYSELYEDNIYFLYNGYSEDSNPILEYYADNDFYRICDYDGQCLIEYDDGSETSGISIMDFAGIYAYDGSFEADDRAIDFYYLLEIGEWDGYSFSIAETWRGNMLIQDEYARAKSLIVDTLTFDIYNPDVGYETHSLTYVPANESTLGKDVIYLDGDNTMPFVRD